MIVKPAAHLDRLDEVLVITSTEPRFPPQEQTGPYQRARSEESAVPAAIKDQMKASEIMAEKLPGLIDPNLPPDQQPLNDNEQPESRRAAAAAVASRRVFAGLQMTTSGATPAADSDAEAEEFFRPLRPTQVAGQTPAGKSANAKPQRRRRGTHSHGRARRRLPARYEIHRYPLLVYALVPLAALVLQAWLPRVVGRYDWFDLPLVITVYFALGRRNPIQGTLMGAAMGLFEDALSHHAIGINGIAKTVVGFLAAQWAFASTWTITPSACSLNFVLSLLSSAVYLFVSRFMLGLAMEWSWLTELCCAPWATR